MMKRNEMKSLSEIRVRYGVSYAIVFISQPLGHRKAPGYHIYIFPIVNYFPDLIHINIQRVKTHIVGNHATTPVFKQIHVEYYKLRTKYLEK